MSKKPLCLLLALFIFVLSSCSLTSDSSGEIKKIFALPVRVSASTDGDISVSLNAFENESVFTFNSPATLSLMTVKKNQSGYFAHFDGMDAEIKPESVMAADALDIAVRAIISGTVEGERREDGLTLALFSIDGSNILVYYDTDGKTPKKITAETLGRVFEYEINSVESIKT